MIIKLQVQTLTDGSEVYSLVIEQDGNEVLINCNDKKSAVKLALSMSENVQKYSVVNVVYTGEIEKV